MAQSRRHFNQGRHQTPEYCNNQNQFDIEALRIHGYSDTCSLSSSDSGKSEFDEEYYKHQPAPTNISLYEVVVIGNDQQQSVNGFTQRYTNIKAKQNALKNSENNPQSTIARGTKLNCSNTQAEDKENYSFPQVTNTKLSVPIHESRISRNRSNISESKDQKTTKGTILSKQPVEEISKINKIVPRNHNHNNFFTVTTTQPQSSQSVSPNSNQRLSRQSSYQSDRSINRGKQILHSNAAITKQPRFSQSNPRNELRSRTDENDDKNTEMTTPQSVSPSTFSSSRGNINGCERNLYTESKKPPQYSQSNLNSSTSTYLPSEIPNQPERRESWNITDDNVELLDEEDEIQCCC